MSEREAASPFGVERRHLEQMLYDGAPFSELEETIERAPLADDDERAALWLTCWALSKRRLHVRAPAPAPRPRQAPLVVVRD